MHFLMRLAEFNTVFSTNSRSIRYSLLMLHFESFYDSYGFGFFISLSERAFALMYQAIHRNNLLRSFSRQDSQKGSHEVPLPDGLLVSY